MSNQMTFPARLTELIEKATKGPIIAYEDVQEAGKLKLFFSAIKDSNGENLVRASGAQSMSDFLLWAYLVNHAEAIRDLVVAARIMCGQDGGDDLEAEAKMVEALAKLEEA